MVKQAYLEKLHAQVAKSEHSSMHQMAENIRDQYKDFIALLATYDGKNKDIFKGTIAACLGLFSFSPKELAALTETSPSTVSRWVRQGKGASATQLGRLAIITKICEELEKRLKELEGYLEKI